MNLSPCQQSVLRSYAQGGDASYVEPLDWGADPLWWHRRERTIESLKRRGLVDDNGITEAGRTVHARATGETP